MRVKVFFLCLFTALFCVVGCTRSSDSISEKTVLKAVNRLLEEKAISEKFEVLTVGSYECNDEATRLTLRKLKAAGLLDYKVERYAWWEKGSKRVREQYQVTRSNGWWSYPQTEYRTVNKTTYDFEDHYFVDVALTRAGKSLVVDKVPTPKDEEEDEDMKQPDYSAVEYAWDKADLTESWPEVRNPFVEYDNERSDDVKSPAAKSNSSETKQENSSTNKKKYVERIDSLQYQAYSNRSEASENVYMRACKIKAVKARNIQLLEQGGVKKISAQVILKIDDVSDVGRIISHVEKGIKELIDVKLIHYIDKGWVVEEDDK